MKIGDKVKIKVGKAKGMMGRIVEILTVLPPSIFNEDIGVKVRLTPRKSIVMWYEEKDLQEYLKN
jgi:ribosomal protein L24